MAGVSGRVLGQRGGCHTYPFDDEEPLDGYTRYNLGWMKVIYYYAQIQATPDMHTVMINGFCIVGHQKWVSALMPALLTTLCPDLVLMVILMVLLSI
ncbi:hypothetical protein BDV09DRAFT_137334 [Aspergillus tetrazonus]